MYLLDWDSTFPTNRPYTSDGKLGPIRPYVKLTMRDTDEQDQPARFEHGPNWVEGLDVYVGSASKSDDPSSAWRCATVTDQRFPKGSRTAGVTYVFNRSLIEKQEKVVKLAANLMMVRETDRLVNAELRPVNDSTGSPDEAPVSAFLTERDARFGKTNPELHANASHILFVDGHVKLFDAARFTDHPEWDADTGQWYNYTYTQSETDSDAGWNSPNKSIAITP